MKGEGLALHLVLWLHQHAGIWQPALMAVAFIVIAVLQCVRCLRHCYGWRAGVRAFWQEWGAPGLIIGAGLVLLMSPGWSWVDDAILRAELRFVHPPTAVIQGETTAPAQKLSCSQPVVWEGEEQCRTSQH